MLLHELGLLPLRIPSVTAVTGNLARGRTYRLPAGNGAYLNIGLHRVTMERPGQPLAPIAEHVVRDLQMLSHLARPGERYVEPTHAHTTQAERDANPAYGRIQMTARTGRKLHRILYSRNLLRTERGL